jgi:uncharacterized membrane protein YqhA
MYTFVVVPVVILETRIMCVCVCVCVVLCCVLYLALVAGTVYEATMEASFSEVLYILSAFP